MEQTHCAVVFVLHKKQRLVVDAFDEVLGGDVLVAVGVGLDEGIGVLVPNSGAFVSLAVLNDGLVQQVVAEVLTVFVAGVPVRFD